MAVRAAMRGILRYINNDQPPPEDESATADAASAMEEAEEKNDEDDDDEESITDTTATTNFSFSFSQALFRNSLLFPNAKDNVSITVETNETCNPLGPPSIATSVSSVAGPGLRSILVDASKAERKSKRKETSDTETLDEDKFVRFGK